MKIKSVIFKCYFHRKAHSTEHHSRGCPHMVLISQPSRLNQCELSVLLRDTTNWHSCGFEPSTSVS